MNKSITIQIPYNKINDRSYIKQKIQLETGLQDFQFSIIKKSIDARSKDIKYTLKILLSEYPVTPEFTPQLKHVNHNSPVVHIIGAGPAGLFAALRCLELGIKPILIEQGKNVKDRRRDLAMITKNGIVNPYSNYCFGEGGAGTYSDGKLYTRSDKRGNTHYILNYLIYFGAQKDILIDAHPHIGTNKLPKIIENIRHTILSNGGEIYFQHQLIDFTFNHSQSTIASLLVKRLTDNTILEMPCQQVILATGHSARSIFELLYNKKIHLEFKPFAIGVRVEHPQEHIDKIQYHCKTHQAWEEMRNYLPPARYTLLNTTSHYSSYSFCMCPGGIIAPCATDSNEVVTNGWSPSKRNNPFANSGIVVNVDERILPEAIDNPLAGMYYQKMIEQKAFEIGGKNLYAPAQKLVDFINNKESSSLPDCSYRPGVTPSHLKTCLPAYIYSALRSSFLQFDKKMKGFITEDAVVVAPESRTSSPVRIPREKHTYRHVQITNLYPCAEGAGYAGGIMSAAMDGINIVNSIYNDLK